MSSAIRFEAVALARPVPISEAWEGAVALATVLDKLTEGGSGFSVSVFIDAVHAIAHVDGRKLLDGLIVSGLIEEHVAQGPSGPLVVAQLTRRGRLLIIHATAAF